MNFWKILKLFIDQTLPDWRDKFLAYKYLKHQLKIIYPEEEKEAERPNKRMRSDQKDHDNDHNEESVDFVKLLEEEVDKINEFFTDKEEFYVIRSKVLQEMVKEARSSNVRMLRVGRLIVDFYGQVVLLENYSVLNYTGLVKILKKYDKRRGVVTRSPFIQKVLQEPFVRTDVLNKLVKECETMLEHLFSINDLSAPSTEVGMSAAERSCPLEVPSTEAAPKIESSKERSPLKVLEDFAEIEHMENTYLKLTFSAYKVLKRIRSGSSTVSMFSLPPMQD